MYDYVSKHIKMQDSNIIHIKLRNTYIDTRYKNTKMERCNDQNIRGHKETPMQGLENTKIIEYVNPQNI